MDLSHTIWIASRESYGTVAIVVYRALWFALIQSPAALRRLRRQVRRRLNRRRTPRLVGSPETESQRK